MARLMHQEVLDYITLQITTLNPLAKPHEVKLVGYEFEGLNEQVQVVARLDVAPEVVSDALIVGLKKMSLDATNGIELISGKMDWGRESQDFMLLFFSVDMMKSCGG